MATSTEIRGGSMTLSGDGTATLVADVVTYCRRSNGGLRQEEVPQTSVGEYTVSRDSVLTVVMADGAQLELLYDSAALEFRSTDLGAKWRREGQAEAVASERPDRLTDGINQDAYSAYRDRSVGYRCTEDGALIDAPPISAPDTASLGRRISSAFPGYHLSTEQEIACRFPLIDGSTPSTYVEAFASGEAWWVKEGDVDGDGRADLITVLTSDSDPSSDLLVVLLASGEGYPVTRLNGWGFQISDDDAEILIHKVYWDKAAETYRWNGEGFESRTPNDDRRPEI